MKTFFSLLVTGILLAGYSQGQGVPGRFSKDSLARILDGVDSDSLKSRASFLLADEWMDSDTGQARKYATFGEGFSRAYPFWRAVSLLYRAKLTAATAPDSAAKMFMQAEKKLKEFHSREAMLFRSVCWHDYARVFHFNKDDPETYINLLLNQAVPLAFQSGDQLYLGKNYLDISFGFKNLREFSKAETYLHHAIETLRNRRGNTTYLAAAYHTLSENCSLSGKPVQAALYLDSMRLLLMPYPDAVAWLDYYAAESMRLTIAEKFEQSGKIADKGIALARQLQQKYPEQRLLLQKFYALYNNQNLTQARDVALDLSRRKPFIDNASNRLQLFYGLVATYEGLNNVTAAYKWLQRYSRLSDSLSKSNLETKINALEIKFRNAEHQKKITELNAANEKANFSLKRTRLLSWSLGLISVLLLVVLLLWYLFYKSRKKAATQLEQIKISHAMLQGQEEERGRVARDLHDGLGGLLTSVKMNLSEAASGDLNGSRPGLETAIGQLDRSISELRRVAHNMMPEMLLRLGLEVALRDLCDSFVSETTAIRFQCYDMNQNLPQQEQVMIYRIIQELLTNAVKHASATGVLLQCNQRGNRFFITVEDNGVGFNAIAGNQKQGMGINNIRNRVAYLNGKVDILAGPNGQGVSINIEVYVTSEIQTGHTG